MKMNTKILAVAVVVMFCITAYAQMADSDDSQAADSDYHTYLTILDEKGNVVLSIWISFKSSSDPTQYADATTKAMQDALKNRQGITPSDYKLTWTGQYFWFIGPDGMYTGTAYNANGEWKHSDATDKQYTGSKSIAVTYYPSLLKGYFYATKDQCIDGVKYIEFIESGQTYYDRAPDAGPNDYAKKSNTILYVAIAIVAILVILALAYYFLVAKKKGAAA